MKVFGVDFRFCSSGDVFTHGLSHAAETLGIPYAHADVNDPALPAAVDAFAPDLLLVVHGRVMAKRHAGLLNRWRSAVWLLDEPYETDEVARWSQRFTFAFLNDPVTMDRHPNALAVVPTCYDPAIHYTDARPRVWRVAFIGGQNPTRERFLAALGPRLDLLVGQYANPGLQRKAKLRDTRPPRTAELYRETSIVVNVFRDVHQYNREGRPATCLNPRIYEASACGALVISDYREELARVAPAIPTFRTVDEGVELVDHYLANPVLLAEQAERARLELAGETYAARLRLMLEAVGRRAEAVA